MKRLHEAVDKASTFTACAGDVVTATSPNGERVKMTLLADPVYREDDHNKDGRWTVRVKTDRGESEILQWDSSAGNWKVL